MGLHQRQVAVLVKDEKLERFKGQDTFYRNPKPASFLSGTSTATQDWWSPVLVLGANRCSNRRLLAALKNYEMLILNARVSSWSPCWRRCPWNWLRRRLRRPPTERRETWRTSSASALRTKRRSSMSTSTSASSRRSATAGSTKSCPIFRRRRKSTSMPRLKSIAINLVSWVSRKQHHCAKTCATHDYSANVAGKWSTVRGENTNRIKYHQQTWRSSAIYGLTRLCNERSLTIMKLKNCIWATFSYYELPVLWIQYFGWHWLSILCHLCSKAFGCSNWWTPAVNRCNLTKHADSFTKHTECILVSFQVISQPATHGT